MAVAGFQAESIWTTMEHLAGSSVAGGRSYDAFVLQILNDFGAEAMATFNPAHFLGLPGGLPIIDPSQPEG
jgi:hypothetical protein